MSGQSYDDIINLPHHVSPTRPKMSMANRAAQFSPFAALSGYDAAIAETARQTDRYVEPEEERAAQLNEQLQRLAELPEAGKTATVTYFVPDKRKSGGAYVRATVRVKQVDPHRQALVLADGTTIPFHLIYEIQGG